MVFWGIKMYWLQRLCNYVIEKHNNWEKHIIHKTYKKFLLTNEQFDFLWNLKAEYEYELANNIIVVDRHPSVLQGHVPEDLVWDYSRHMNEKFFVMYEYEKVDNV